MTWFNSMSDALVRGVKNRGAALQLNTTYGDFIWSHDPELLSTLLISTHCWPLLVVPHTGSFKTKPLENHLASFCVCVCLGIEEQFI